MITTKKKSFFLVLSLLMVLSACGGGDDTSTTETGEVAEEPAETLDSPATTSAITLHNTVERMYDNVVGKATSLNESAVYAYSYVIFTAANFLNGESL